MEQELTEMCTTIFSCIASLRSNAMVERMAEFALNGKIPFKANSIVNDRIYDNSNYDLGVVVLGEFKIYDSLKTYRDGDDSIKMTRYLRLTKGENEQELDIEL